jgi:poly(beta-D-mannuronate) lyase
MGRFLLLFAACFAAVTPTAKVFAEKALRSPWDSKRIRLTPAPYNCPAVVHISPDLTTDGFYSDSKSSVIDPVKWKAYVESSGPIKNLGEQTVAAADAYRTTGSRAAAQCVLRHLTTAAADGALTGKMSSRQAYYVQGWVIGALAISYLKIHDSGVVPPADAQSLAKWMRTAARQTMDFYDAAKAKPGGAQSNLAQNNHLYWAGVEVAAIAVAANDRSMFDWAISAYRNGVAQITPDGTLPLEMRRGQRALHYHLYAIAPLVYLAEFGQDNKLGLFEKDRDGLQRLVNRATEGLAGSGYFDQATGIKQDTPHGPPTAEEISWARIYVHHFPNPQISALIAQAGSLSYMYLGGLPPY